MPDTPDRDEWWKSRIPRDGETEQQAIERLHRSPGYGGSLEDARAAVWSAMDFARGRSPTPVPEEGRTEMAGGDVIACVDPERWDHAGAPQLAYANGWNDALAGLPRGSASAAERKSVPIVGYLFEQTVGNWLFERERTSFLPYEPGDVERFGIRNVRAVVLASDHEAALASAEAGDGVASALPSPLPSQGEPVAWPEPLGFLKPEGPSTVEPRFVYAKDRTETWMRQVFFLPVFGAEALAAAEARADSLKAQLDEAVTQLKSHIATSEKASAFIRRQQAALTEAEARTDRAEEDVLDRLYEKWLLSGGKASMLSFWELQGAMLPADRAALRARTILKTP